MTYTDELRVKEIIERERPLPGLFSVVVFVAIFTAMFFGTEFLQLKFDQIDRHLKLPPCTVGWSRSVCP